MMRWMLHDAPVYDSLRARSAELQAADVYLRRTEATMKADRDREILLHWRVCKNLSKTAKEFGISRHLAKQSVRRAALAESRKPV
jgi:hypothetical protein